MLERTTRRSTLERSLPTITALAVSIGSMSLAGSSRAQTDPQPDASPSTTPAEQAPAFVLVESVSVTDQNAFAQYQKLARDAITQFGGIFLARGAQAMFLEGDADCDTLGLLQFPSTDVAQQWFSSPEFQQAVQVRRTAGEQRIVLVEGEPSGG